MSTNPEIIEQRLKASGHRLTKTRKALLNTLISSARPLSIEDMGAQLKVQGIAVNKTTIYREVDFLLKQKLLEEVRLDPERRYYEFALGTHHHHIRCLSCGAIEDVSSTALEQATKQVKAGTMYQVIDHMMEFAGLCPACQR
ncbi:MAG: hypothetical protein COW24_02595 [Candidatus Kerfeldbacteria bacterium CG15_BIG_FIL_POST_REV_8_21_14_020_45_12]|uniref:Transcriptional repressor n=1 Tax=Candidatus Kerfeldbacteria bacterium CG15_BIG_FIL_POST_REV_8_21_14_020_45_12 TaxID=2014247 RepID=A0A2M7H437_9BACT|nr:MAG: hypothetical protein COW24_02595 [Candidatus Kerfeldbacteria bacterium CG15_BIG_FIL_POST_REV_8_21_14_020_45_12]PJA93887.1 MAG: hypothetical protein CO132_00860 [Candidatus Kerfeldbacteria bacterium CG_4_9_14_3_um_filter_45_8]